MERKEHYPYQNAEGERIDFLKKRLDFWLETVPKDIRKWEYELWRRYRTFVHADFFSRSQKHETLRPIQTDSFTQEIQNQYWQQFQDSFLHGHERNERFKEILLQIELHTGDLLTQIPGNIDQDKIRLIALTGSSFYGPRKKSQYMSDIDVNFLIDQEDDSMNFEIRPTVNESDIPPYHLFGTGKTDQSRGSRPIHWLLYPHYPIKNSIPDGELRDVIHQLIDGTYERKEEIEAEINSLSEAIKLEEKENPRGWTK